MRKRPAIEPERPPIMARFWGLPLLVVAPAVAEGVDALSCVFDAAASEVMMGGLVLLVTSVGSGPAAMPLLESDVVEDDDDDVDNELVQELVVFLVEGASAVEPEACVGEISVVNCTVTKVVWKLVSSTVTVDIGVPSLVIVITPVGNTVVACVDVAPEDTSGRLVEAAPSEVKRCPSSWVTASQISLKGTSRRCQPISSPSLASLPLMIAPRKDRSQSSRVASSQNTLTHRAPKHERSPVRYRLSRLKRRLKSERLEGK